MVIYDLETPQELLEYMNDEIRYGWLDNNNNEHIDTMKNYKKHYKWR